jgi:hypothetical protein
MNPTPKRQLCVLTQILSTTIIHYNKMFGSDPILSDKTIENELSSGGGHKTPRGMVHTARNSNLQC